ncbi:ketopantoate reductase PanE/ApbA C terminal-domain-containing protein [Myxozyma melibiosi]|uniref:2-dehydropantoate 2-reductase n=1 Tax=Myxozyma melibiosi TaxID=54550 RepID=A0ABR1FDB8_9ASCO
MQHHRVYILGPGSIGTFMAYGLNRGPDPPPTVLIFQDTATASKFNERKTLKLLTSPERPERNVLGVVGISVDALYYLPLTIENLVVCTKAHQTINALKSVAYRLLPTSTVLLMQNGMGLLDEIYREIWPNPALRPRIMIGINTHGVTRTSTLGVVTRNGSSGLTLSSILKDYEEQAPPGHYDLLDYTYHNKFVTRLIESPILGAREVSYSDLLRTQVQKMVANCCINPLTAILDVPNGHMASSKYMRRAIVAIIRETVKVLDVLPEIKATFSTYEREGMLDVAQLKEYVYSIARQTAENTSSMRADILAGRTTEIDYLNGYIAASGRKYGVQTPINSYLAHIVKHKTSSDGNDMIYSPGSVVQTILSEDRELVTPEAEAVSEDSDPAPPEAEAGSTEDSKKVAEADDAFREASEASEVEDRSVA